MLTILYHGTIIFLFGFYNALPPLPTNLFTTYITNMGAHLGLDIFYILLGIMGLILTRREKILHIPFYIVLILIMLLTLVQHDLIIMVNVLVAYLVTITFLKLSIRKWKLKIIKNLTVIFIITGFFFSFLSFAVRIIEENPNQALVDALSDLRQRDPGKVLSHPRYGSWIQFYAKQSVLLEETPGFIDDRTFIINQSFEAFHSFNLKKTKSILQRFDITYILITNDMKQNLVWTKPDDGLLFLLNDNETFKRIYENSEVSLWQVRKNENEIP